MKSSDESLIDISGGNAGEYWIGTSDVAVTGKRFNIIEVTDDTVFTTLGGVDKDGSIVDYLVRYNLTSKTVLAGNFIKALEGGHISSVTVTGQVKGVNL